MLSSQLQVVFTNSGAEFLISSKEISKKLETIKAFIFDWDGVFNSAEKNESRSSNFNEADSMGTNLLRFSYYLKNKKMPFTAIISGEKNQQSFYFTTREHFHSCYFKFSNKIDAFQHFCKQHNLQANEVAYFFDDVLDLSIAKVCGLRILINRNAGILFKNYIRKNKLADYITFNDGSNYAIREACELLMACNDNFDEVLDKRTDFDSSYKKYIELRNKMNTDFFTTSNGEILQQQLSIQL
jgi:3-deoxy-D-manno-octulosonate 8-phosphate phosphatase (KDO 8-P phosphatase)